MCTRTRCVFFCGLLLPVSLSEQVNITLDQKETTYKTAPRASRKVKQTNNIQAVTSPKESLGAVVHTYPFPTPAVKLLALQQPNKIKLE